MFEQATLSNGPAAKRALTTFAGVTSQAIIVTGIILAPMLFPQVLPKVTLTVPTVFAPVHRSPDEPKSGVIRVAPLRSSSTVNHRPMAGAMPSMGSKSAARLAPST